MFDSIPPGMAARMADLEKIDAADRIDGTERMKRLRQVPNEIGRLIAMFAAAAPEGRYVEIGTSAGYSTMWLSLACRELGRKITTFEVLPAKIALARETFRQAGIEDVVELVHADGGSTSRSSRTSDFASSMRRRKSISTATSCLSLAWSAAASSWPTTR
jgi:caffeoyl-CoA O-methyltransferase